MQSVRFSRFRAFAAFESSHPFILIRKVLPLLASYPSAICASACFCAFKTLTAILIITWSNTQTTHRNLLNLLIYFAFVPPTFEANKPLYSHNESCSLHATNPNCVCLWKCRNCTYLALPLSGPHDTTFLFCFVLFRCFFFVLFRLILFNFVLLF